MLAGIPVILRLSMLTQFFHSKGRLGQKRLLPIPFQFIIHQAAYHRRYQNHRKTNCARTHIHTHKSMPYDSPHHTTQNIRTSNRFNDGNVPTGITIIASSIKCRSFPRVSYDIIDVCSSISHTRLNLSDFLTSLFHPFFIFACQHPPSSLCIKLYNSVMLYKPALTWNS